MFPTLRLAWHDVLLLILGYVFLDWVSYIHPLYGLNITPWSPAAALGLVYVLRYGPRAALALGVAILIADAWVRHLPAALPLWFGISALLTAGYWAIAAILRRRLAGTALFMDLRGLLEWVAIVAVGTLLNSIAFVSALSFARLIPGGAWIDALVRYWVGDCVGIIVCMPVFWMLLDERGRAKLRAVCTTWRMALYLLVTLISLWVAFGIGAQANYKYFYVLFLPIVWTAARDGLTGAVLGATMVQLGIIGSVQLLGFPALTVLEIQTLMVVLALLGFFIGIVVDERQRVSAELRQTLRLAAAGEMAGALAHEINQPLTALSAYGAACEQLLARGDTGERLRDAVQRMVAESHRAADVVRRLRDFFRTGATQLEPVALRELLSAATGLFAEKAKQQDIVLHSGDVPECTLLADRLQIEVVLRNLLSNAFDAVADEPRGKRSVTLSAHMESQKLVCIRVEDSGAGVPAELAAHLFEAFHSSKASGLGLGLTISRAIAEAHGGSLVAEAADHGIFKLFLPVEGTRSTITTQGADHAA
ncbi:MAG TPA: ATP-binding protein [Noviherbaspirillum sp.]|uniref:ATP-binding protein n=1 Tax=Noviherbaspirillum sp. TaxID=1926288 RepID=UPI002B47D5D2|nr:ATP-binding protein [Noviherbaspirillum sp.]HJV83866.1 ATP-binding protein [Noviherbaspirillum sp.]